MTQENALERLRERNAAVELPPDEFRSIGHRLVDQLADFLAGLPSRPVTAGETPAEVRAAIASNRALPESGREPASIASEAAELLMAHSLFNGHPRFFGYITSSAAPIGAFGDLIASVLNCNVGAWKLAPAATEIEAQTIRWIAEFIGYRARLRRTAGERRQHGELRRLSRRSGCRGWCGTSEARCTRNEPATVLLLTRNAHVDSEGSGYVRAGDGVGPMDCVRRSPAS